MERDKNKSRSTTTGPHVMREAVSRSRSRSSNRLHKGSNVAVGFINFIRNHSIVTLAVGFVIATQAEVLIKQLVTSFITPTFQFFVNGSLLKDTVKIHVNGKTIDYTWGVFVNDLLTLLFTMLAIYLIIRIFKLDKLDKPADSK